MGDVMEMAAAQTLLAVEAALDAEIEKTENLDEDDYQRIKQKRIAEMKRKAEQEQSNVANGHGTLIFSDKATCALLDAKHLRSQI